MCRFFALRANQPTRGRGGLLTAPHALHRQCCGDRRGLCHDSGWGVGWYEGRQAHRVRSPATARDDPRYRALAETVCATTLLAHIRLASAGGVAEKNSHPFVFGRWMFAHNGTLFGFADDPGPLRRLIPDHLRNHVEGETDSEHAFYFLLARLEEGLGRLDGSVRPEGTARVLGETLAALADLYPGRAEELSQLNVVLTNGDILLAARWGHTLFWLERREPDEGDRPVREAPGYRAIVTASEPTTEEPWQEVPERSALLVAADLSHVVVPLHRQDSR